MAAVQDKEAASASKDVYTKTEAIIDSAQFKNQYEMQDQFKEIYNDDIEIVFDEKSGHFMIKGEYINVAKAVEQLKILQKKPDNGNHVIKEPETNAKGGEVQDKTDSTGQHVMQNPKKDKRERNLVKNLTPGIADLPLKQNIPIDEHVWHYLMFKHAKRVANISSKSQCDTKVVSNFSEGRVTFSLEVTSKGSTKNLDDAVEEFAMLYQEVTQPGIGEEVVKLPAEWSKAEVEKLTKELSSVDFMLMTDTVYRLIGPSVNLVEAKEKLGESLQSHYSHAIMADEQKNDSGPQKSGSGSPGAWKSNSIAWKNDSGPQRNGSASPKYDSGAWNNGPPKYDSNPLNFQTPGGLHVFVSQGNLIHQKVDAIVNPANSTLRHGGGAARAIADAAGYDLIKESKEFISRHGEIKETNVMKTSAGNLSPRIKYVIHAVGPQKTHYTDNKVLFQQVQETVFNCLMYANDKMKIQSIAIPAISSGIYGVPLDIVAQASFKALEEFDRCSSQKKTLRTISFLNNDEKTFLCMRGIFESLSKKKFGISVDKENHNQVGPFDRHAEIFGRHRITTSPCDQCFTRAISTALEQDLHMNYDQKKVMEEIKKEFEIHSDQYKAFRLSTSWLDFVKNFISSLQSGQSESVDAWLHAAANAFSAQIVLVQLLEDGTTGQTEFNPRYEKTDRQLFIAYYYTGHHHFDALIKNKETGTEMNGEETSGNSKFYDSSKPIMDQPRTASNHYSSSSSMNSLDQSYEKVEKSEADDMNCKDKKVDEKSSGTAEAKPNEDNDDNCIICMDKIVDQKTLPCKHKFCRECIDAYFAKGQPKCPSCGKVFGVLKGDQPKGTMNVTEKGWTHLQGYPGCGTIEITYSFPDGTQGDSHPNPGQRYKGTYRTAYLPANREGKEVRDLLKRAFDAGLVFTIGRSNTTGQENVVIWNDVHHKTSQHGQYGYPDPTYLKRVREELAAKGIQ